MKQIQLKRWQHRPCHSSRSSSSGSSTSTTTMPTLLTPSPTPTSGDSITLSNNETGDESLLPWEVQYIYICTRMKQRTGTSTCLYYLRGTIIIRTFDLYKKLYIPVFLPTVFGPDYQLPRYQGVRGGFGGVGFLEVCFLYKINPSPRNMICCGKKWPKCHFEPIFSWVGLALVCGFRRFHTNIYMFSNQPNRTNTVYLINVRTR